MKNIEIEFKALLDEKLFDELKSIYSGDTFTQTNHYFDTEDFLLKANNMALRIRVKDHNSKITLKHKIYEDGRNYIVEISDLISDEQVYDILKYKTYFTEPILNYLKEFNISTTQFPNYINFVTQRQVVCFEDHKLFLDKTIFKDYTDYELEIEADDYLLCKSIFDNYAQKYGLVENTRPKIERAFSKRP